MDHSSIQHLAKLAKLHIEADQTKELADSITNVLNMVNQLTEADLGDVPPMANPLDQIQRLREDKITEDNVREAYQALAPATQDGLFLVPQVID